MVLMDVSKQVSTNVREPTGLTAPINQSAHGHTFPEPSFTIVVRPNADTLYSSLNFDVSKEPLIITVPDSGGRFYLLPFLDEWTDVFAVPGKRTTGTTALTFAIVGPNWRGELPADVKRYDSPTAFGWMGGRTQTNGKADYEAVHNFQDGIKAVPISAYGKPYIPPKGNVNPKQDMSVPPDQIDKMDAAISIISLRRARPRGSLLATSKARSWRALSQSPRTSHGDGTSNLSTRTPLPGPLENCVSVGKLSRSLVAITVPASITCTFHRAAGVLQREAVSTRTR